MLGDKLCVKIESGFEPNLSAANSGNLWLDYFHVYPAADQHVPPTDVSPHLIFKNGPHPTLWPSDVPFPGEETDTKGDITVASGGYHDDDSQGTPDGSGGMHYPSYFKDSKGE